MAITKRALVSTVLCLAAAPVPDAFAKTYGAGSLIVPMDSTLQGTNGAGLFRAYGLVFQLLKSGVPVDWVIRANKAYGESDFDANVGAIDGSGMKVTASFAGGPFVVDASNRATAFPIVTAWLAQNSQVVVVEARDPFEGSVARALIAAPSFAVLNDGFECLLYNYLNAAGIPDSLGRAWPSVGGGTTRTCDPTPTTIPELLPEGKVAGATTSSHRDGALFDANGTSLYCALFSMHYASNDGDQAEVVAEVAEHLRARGSLVTTCEATRSFENKGHYLTQAGINDGAGGSFPSVLQGFPGHLIAQNTGAFGVRNGLLARWDPASPGYRGNEGTHYHRIVRQEFLLGNQDDVVVAGYAFGDTTNGRAVFIGGHSYQTDPTSNGSRGVRTLLNALLGSQCTGTGPGANDDGVARVTTTFVGPTSPTGNAVMDFTYTYRNTGHGSALGLRLVVPVPAGTSVSNITGGGVDEGSQVVWDFGNVASLSPPQPAAIAFRLTAAQQGTYNVDATTSYRRGQTLVTSTSRVTIAFAVTASPKVAAPILAASTGVAGECEEADGTTIRVLVNDAQVATTSVTGSSWSVTGLSPLVIGDRVKARALAAGKVESPDSNVVTVTPIGTTAQPIVQGPLVEGATTVSGTTEPGATVEVFVRTGNTNESRGFAVVSDSLWTLSSLSPPLAASQIVTAVATLSGFSPSPPSEPVTVLAKTAPPVLTTPIVAGDSVVTGTCETGALVTLLVDGTPVGTGVASGTTFGIAARGLAPGDVVTATAIAPGKAGSDTSAPAVVLARTPRPSITGPITVGATAVSGTSPAQNASITLYVNGSARGSVGATGGAWTLMGLSPALGAGQIVTATAQAPSEAASFFSDPVVVGATTSSPAVAAPLTRGDTVVRGTSIEADGTRIDLFVANVLTATTSVAGGAWQATLGSPLRAGDEVRARAIALNESPSVLSAPVIVRDISRTPSVSSPILAGVVLVRGTCREANGARIDVFVDNAEVATGTVDDATFTISVPALLAGQIVQARATAIGKGPSAFSGAVTVAAGANNVSTPPTVTAPIVAGATTVVGSTVEVDATRIALFVDGEGQGNVNAAAGMFAFTALPSLQAGQSITATATAPTEGTSAPSSPVIVGATTSPPVVASPIFAGATQVQGACSEPDGTRIDLFVNGSAAGNASVAANAWSLSGLVAFSANDGVSARATAVGRATSPPSNVVIVSANGGAQSAPPVISPAFAGATVVSGTTTEADGTLLRLSIDGVPRGTVTASSGSWSVIGLAPLLAGARLVATATAPGKGTSAPSSPVIVGSITEPPLVDALDAGATAVAGASREADGTVIEIFVDGSQQAGTASVAGGRFVFTVSPLEAGRVVTARATAPSKARSAFGNSVVVGATGAQSSSPSLFEPLVEGARDVVGASVEADGTLIEVYLQGAFAGRATVVAGGWSASVAPLLAGASVTAVATAPGEQPSAHSSPVIVLARSDAPTVTAPLSAGTSIVAGTSHEGSGAEIDVYVNGARVAAAIVSNGAWSVMLPAALIAGDGVYAIATGIGKGPSRPSNTVTVSTPQGRSDAPMLAAPIIVGDTMVRGTSAESPGARIDVYVEGALVASTTVTSSSPAGGDWLVVGLAPLAVGQVVSATATAPGEGTSAPGTATVLARSLAPVITSVLGEGDTTVSGTSSEPSGTMITVVINSIGIGSGTVSAGGAWSVTVPPLALAAEVRAIATAVGKGPSFPSAPVVVLAKAAPPIIDTPIRTTDTQIRGTVSDTNATVSIFINGALRGSVSAVGASWSFTTSAALQDGDVVTAVAVAPGRAPSNPSAPAIVYGRTEAPSVRGPLIEGELALSGACPAGATVEVFIGGASAGLARVDGTSWTLSIGAPLVAGEPVTAIATVDPRLPSDPSPAVVVLRRSVIPELDAPIVEGATSVTGTSVEVDGALIVVFVDGVPVASAAAMSGVFAVTVNPLAAGARVTATAQASGEAASFHSVAVTVLRRTRAPSIDSPIFAGATMVAGASDEAAGTNIEVRVNGASAASTVVNDAARWSASVFPLVAAQSVTAIASAVGAAPSPPSAAVIVLAPVADAGIADAGIADAGVVDAGIADAGMVDAGVADAGPLDAGVADAGTHDGGSPDGGAADAGTSDGGGLLDAGVFADGGLPTDGGGESDDAGTRRVTGGAFSCAAAQEKAGSSFAAWLVLCGALVLARRRIRVRS
jgi:hypothetical protein